MNEKFEFKSAASGAIALDELQGIVECFVAGIGNKDSVGDIVVTGAFAKSLTRRKPRVVWAHSWNDPIGKVLEMYEVPAGDPRLPAKMRNAGIGGLYAKVQFNLQSEKGKEAFASVAFFGEEQEWK
jgi:HK97 family phage prohead protease